GDSLREVVLQKLIRTDLEVRWRRGQAIRLEQYLEQFPELGTLQHLPPELVYEEYRIRQCYGDKPGLAAYQTRFPDQFDEFQRLAREQPVGTLRGSVATRIPAPVLPPAGSGVSAGSEVLLVGGGYKLLRRIGRG